MSEEIARALEDAARKAEQGLSHDFADAYHSILKDTEKKTGQVADNAATNEADTVDNLTKSAEGKAAGAGSDELTPGQSDGEAGTPQTHNVGPGGPGVPPEGPPWPAGDNIAGSARGKTLRPVNKRHTVSGVKAGPPKAENSLILRGHEQAVNDDIAQIAAGNAQWDPETQRYTINGRSYGIEPSGTVFPASGDGIVNLSRNEYSALKELIKAGGDPAKVMAFTRAPHFVNDPQSIATALALFNRIFA
ncbi:hypothetical protein GXW83_32695 [Streptacidiphilus sp. PB12-B1b]|uniref:hypothetical protein n=1 Tax=Streptacidiphilus sp. PB12-B1b TaxID=2705012 RepID=UPI0015F8BB1C|nr:hypothetical protein [Streptacidiphilus sp. PB12-B1b]QMU79752.1 hypothetical protein GXW83_32695 [Streptacidiphilus sp. PB12-B1b]